MEHYDPEEEIARITKDWETNPRWAGIHRDYTARDVVKLRGSFPIAHTLATRGAVRLWDLVANKTSKKGYVNALGALTGGQAVQMAKAGLEAIYVSGWQVAADNNSLGMMYPDQSLYPVDSVPRLVQSINNAFHRADQIQWTKHPCFSKNHPNQHNNCEQVKPSVPSVDYCIPIVADAEAGFGGILNAYELCGHLISAGAAAVHFEDQLSSAKKCGHLGGKVLVPTADAVQKIVAARLAADVANVPTVIIARTDAQAADLLTSDYDSRDLPFILQKERTPDGFFRLQPSNDHAIARGLSYAPYADMLWCETSKPSLEAAHQFASAIHRQHPGKLLAYNCSPSFNWKKNLSDKEIAHFQQSLADMGYAFQFITLAGIHSLWYNTYDLAFHYAKGEGMRHYVEKVQEPEFHASKTRGYTFVAHQQEVGVGYFDAITDVIQQGKGTTKAMKGSTEEDQF